MRPLCPDAPSSNVGMCSSFWRVQGSTHAQRRRRAILSFPPRGPKGEVAGRPGGCSPERFRSAKREDQPIRGAAGAPSFLPATRFQGRGRREAGAVPLSDSAARSARTSEGERPRLPDGKTSPYALHLFRSPNDPATTISPSFMMTSIFSGVRSWIFTAGSPFTIRRSAHLPTSREPVSSSQ